MSEFCEHIRSGLEAACLSPDDNLRLLVAVSGGADSVALLRALLELGCDCVVAHCNFHLRGEESDRDERFVTNLCQRLDVSLRVRDFDVEAYQAAHAVSVEMACRELRYAWFDELRVLDGCEFVAVAHHADDNVETFFLNLLRGTGIAGLSGMRSLNGHLLRPMLGVTRTQILRYLQELGQDYVEDSTNRQVDFKRNRIRNVVLPMLNEQFPAASRRITDTMAHLRDERELLDYLIAQHRQRHAACHGSVVRFPKQAVLSAPIPGMMLYALTRHLGFNRNQCDAATKAQVGSQFTTGSFTLSVCRYDFEIQDNKESDKREFQVDFSAVDKLPVKLEVSDNNAPFSRFMVDGKNKVAFGRELLTCDRVVLRHWRKGDRMHPFGMRGSKLLSDLFNDLKLSPSQKKAVWLLEADGTIVWVLGYRAAQTFTVAPESTDYLHLRVIAD